MPTLVTLNDLAEAWNQLRNAALGRSTTPLVNAALATEVADAYEAFRAWLGEQGPIESMIETPTARAWLERHNELRAQVALEAPAPEPLPETLGESMAEATERALRDMGSSGATALFLAGLGVAFVVLLGRRRG